VIFGWSVMSEQRATVDSEPAAPAAIVLIVEDEILVRLSSAEHLREAGFEVLEANSADEALEVLKRFHVDVVFSDVTMPGRIDGLGLTRWVQEHRPAVRTIVTSGSEEAVMNVGGYDVFLSKPYRLVDLDYCLQKVFASAKELPRTLG
jgi:DNA-binding NtrC family response regulator